MSVVSVFVWVDDGPLRLVKGNPVRDPDGLRVEWKHVLASLRFCLHALPSYDSKNIKVSPVAFSAPYMQV